MKKFVIIFAVVVSSVYALSAFISGVPNPMDWTENDRGLFVLASLTAYLAVSVVLYD